MLSKVSLLFLCCIVSSAFAANEASSDNIKIRVAVAANFVASLQQLMKQTPSAFSFDIELNANSTGALYAQISNGAPIDLFLAADTERPMLLVEQDKADSQTLSVYAKGRLALWRDRPLGEAFNLAQWQPVGLLGIAKAKLAPYGLAAQQVIEAIDAGSQYKLIEGNNIAQVFQFAHSGNLNWAFLALSQVKQQEESATQLDGEWLMVPKQYYQPIEQSMVVISQSSKKRQAHEFQAWLLSKAVQSNLVELGYWGAK